MATNAAKELLVLVDSWAGEGSVLSVRRPSAEEVDGFWDAQHRAVRYLAEVEAFLATRDNPSEYKPFIGQLRRFVFATDAVWSQHSTKLDFRDRMLLVAVAELMSATPLSVALEPVQIDALRDAIQKCLDVLDSDPREIQERANYLRYLLHRCLDLLDGEEVDLLALRHLSFEASGVGLDVLSELPEEKRKPFIDGLGGMSRVWFNSATAGAAGNLISEGFTSIVRLIGPGS